MSLIEEAEVLIKENEALIGIVNIDPTNGKYEEYLNFGRDELKEMSRDECIIAQYALSQYAAAVSKRYNLIKGQYQINQAIYFRRLAEVYNKYNEFHGKDLIYASAANDFADIKSMQDQNMKMNSLLLSLEGIVERVDKMIQMFKDLSFTKR